MVFQVHRTHLVAHTCFISAGKLADKFIFFSSMYLHHTVNLAKKNTGEEGRGCSEIVSDLLQSVDMQSLIAFSDWDPIHLILTFSKFTGTIL